MSERRGNDLGTTIKYMRKTTSGAAGIGLDTTAKYTRDAHRAPPRVTAWAPLNYLRGVAG